MSSLTLQHWAQSLFACLNQSSIDCRNINCAWCCYFRYQHWLISRVRSKSCNCCYVGYYVSALWMVSVWQKLNPCVPEQQFWELHVVELNTNFEDCSRCESKQKWSVYEHLWWNKIYALQFLLEKASWSAGQLPWCSQLLLVCRITCISVSCCLWLSWLEVIILTPPHPSQALSFTESLVISFVTL